MRARTVSIPSGGRGLSRSTARMLASISRQSRTAFVGNGIISATYTPGVAPLRLCSGLFNQNGVATDPERSAQDYGIAPWHGGVNDVVTCHAPCAVVSGKMVSFRAESGAARQTNAVAVESATAHPVVALDTNCPTSLPTSKYAL